jgi:hypothetical protein
MTIEIFLCITGAVLVLGFWLYLYMVCKEKRILLIRQVSYDAVAYATEFSESVKKHTQTALSPEAKLDLAVAYLQSVFTLMHEEQAKRCCISIIGKTVATGATDRNKI